MKTQFNKEFNRTYLLGTTHEIAETIAKEMVNRVKRDFNNAIFPEFDFTNVDENDIREDLRYTAELSDGWYGCKDVKTDFNDDYNRTLLADYYGGGAASVASYWIDYCDEQNMRDAIVDVVSSSLAQYDYYDPSLILIVEVVGDVRDNSTEVARIANLMGGRNKIMKFDDGTYLNVRFNKDSRKLEAGIATNTGIYVTYSIDYDFDKNLYDNLSKLYKTISERKNKN